MSIPDLPERFPDDPAEDVAADNAVGDPEGIDTSDPFEELSEESYAPGGEATDTIPATLRLFIRFCDRWGQEIDRETLCLPVTFGEGGAWQAELTLTHMARLS